ncbi:MAG TPA: NAD(+)/NADH kinase [Lacipirellulaceae bacterium]
MATTQPPRAMILADGSRPGTRETLERLRPKIEQHLKVVAVSLDFADDIEHGDAELVIVFGGDGSILRAVHQMGYQQRPVLGVNLGKLGFLADLQPEELDAALPEIAAGRHRVVEHLMFECTAIRDGQTVVTALGLNEASVLAGPPFKMVDVQLYVDGELVTTYSCDGLIVSTPVGSTAHNLSAGGPILQKSLQAFVISPICPHTLTNRPVVDSADRTIELVVPQPHEGTSLVVDGQVLATLEARDRVRIVRSAAVFQMVEVPGQSYYRTLRDKLGWGGQLKRHE